jgi:hypothetical protein
MSFVEVGGREGVKWTERTCERFIFSVEVLACPNYHGPCNTEDSPLGRGLCFPHPGSASAHPNSGASRARSGPPHPTLGLEQGESDANFSHTGSHLARSQWPGPEGHDVIIRHLN